MSIFHSRRRSDETRPARIRRSLVVGLGSLVDLGGTATRDSVLSLAGTGLGPSWDNRAWQTANALFDRERGDSEHSRQSELEKLLDHATRLVPTTYRACREIGELFRKGIVVVIDLRQMGDGDARRVVDFCAGLAFALRGVIYRVENRTFLLAPRITGAEQSGQSPHSSRSRFEAGKTSLIYEMEHDVSSARTQDQVDLVMRDLIGAA